MGQRPRQRGARPARPRRRRARPSARWPRSGWPAMRTTGRKTLSGGEAQRAALARALVREPDAAAARRAVRRARRADPHPDARASCSELCAPPPARRSCSSPTTSTRRSLLADRVLVLTDGVHLARRPVDVPSPRASRATRRVRRPALRLLAELGVDETPTSTWPTPTSVTTSTTSQATATTIPSPRPPMTITDIPHRIALDVTPLSGTIGAEIRGVDLPPLDDDDVAAIRAAWLERKVVFFPGQHLDARPSTSRSRARFGEPTEGHPVIPGIDEHPEVFEIDYTAGPRSSYAQLRRRQHARSTRRPLAHRRHVREAPAARLDPAAPSSSPTPAATRCSRTSRRAFEALSPALQDFLSTLTAVHDGAGPVPADPRSRSGEGQWEGETFTEPRARRAPGRAHPPRDRRAGRCSSTPGSRRTSRSSTAPRATRCSASSTQHAVEPEYVVRYHWTRRRPRLLGQPRDPALGRRRLR